MNFGGLIFLLAAHYLSGRGLLRLFKIGLKPVPAFCLSMITGVFLVSFAPCILQLCGLPIDVLHVIVTIVVLTGIFCIPLLLNFKRPWIGKPPLPVYYEWPFIIACSFLAAVSVWRCFYYPPYARDMLAGPELLAEFAVREHTMVSSVFTLDLHTTNNYFKSPYITCLQILYKLLVCPFGQLWLSVIAVSFWVWLYSILRERIHPLLAGMLFLFFMAIPDVYSYSYIMLYDFSNMVFFFGGFYFVCRYMDSRRQGDFLFAAFLFGAATYIRTETLVLVAMTVPLLLGYFYREKKGFAQVVKQLFIFIIMPAAFWFLCIKVFVRSFVPIPFNLGSQVAPDLSNISFLFERLKDMTFLLIFSPIGFLVYGYFISFFCAVLPVDLIFFRKFNRESKVALYGIAVVYFGLPLLGYLLPLVDLPNTTKRGLFKMLPLMLLYLCNSGFLQYLSGRIFKWEHANEGKKAVVGSAKNVRAVKKGR